MQPEGIILIVVLAAAIIFGLIYAKKESAKIKKEMEERYPAKESYEHAYVTEKGELIFHFEFGSIIEYRKWNLSDIAYIATFRGEMSLLDKDGRAMRGEYLVASSKIQGYSINVGIGNTEGYVAFVKKHGPHIKHSVGGKVVQDKNEVGENRQGDGPLQQNTPERVPNPNENREKIHVAIIIAAVILSAIYLLWKRLMSA